MSLRYLAAPLHQTMILMTNIKEQDKASDYIIPKSSIVSKDLILGTDIPYQINQFYKLNIDFD